MAVRSDAANDRLTRTGGAPDPQAGFTVCGWFYLAVDRDDFSTLIRLHASSGSTTRLTLSTGSSGTLPAIFTPGNTSGVLGVDSFTAGAWMFIAVTQTSTTATIYTCTPGGTMHSASGTSSGGSAPDGYTIFGRSSSDSSEWFNGRGRCLRLWSTVLTPTELAAERDSLTKVKASSIYADYDMVDAATALADSSGNGRNLTAGSTAVTTEADPPIGTSAADTLTGIRASQLADTAATAITRTDMIGGVRAASQADGAAISQAVPDSIGAVRSAALPGAAAASLAMPDLVGVARVASLLDIPAVSIAAVDTTGGARAAVLPESVATGLVLPDLLGGARAYGLPDSSIAAVQTSDTLGGIRVGGLVDQPQATLALFDVIGHARATLLPDGAAAELNLIDSLAVVRVGALTETLPLMLSDRLGAIRVAVLQVAPIGGGTTDPRDLTVTADLLPSRTAARLAPPRWFVKETP